MKNLKSSILILFLLGLIFSCKSDDDSSAQDPDNPNNTDITAAKIDSYVVQPYNDDAYVEDINYTESGNFDRFTYTSPYLIEYVSEDGGTYPNGEPRFYVQYQLDTNGRVTTIISKPQFEYSYRYTLTYNAENYLDEMTIYETRIGNDGYPMEEPKIYQIERLTWEDENLTVWHSIGYDQSGEIYHEGKRRYSGFLPENVNTLGAKNVGFDFFGKGGIPIYFLGGGQHHAFFTDNAMFAGKQIPTKMVYDVLSSDAPDRTTNYIISKDAEGRIKELKTEDGDTWWQNRIYTYED